MPNYQNKVNGLLGLAARAGKIICGTDAVKEAILKKKVYIVILAEDSSLNTREKFLKLSNENKIKIFIHGNIDENSRAIGKKNKAVIGVKDKNFSEAIAGMINGGDAIGQN